MNIKEFAQKVQNAAANILGKEYQVKLQEVSKNNHVTLQGLLILTQNQNVSPTIYLNPFWKAYEEGVPFADIMEKIMQIYREDTPKENVDMEFFKDFNQVKDRICYRLIHGKENEELLEKIPHIEFLDLAVCFYYAYRGETLGEGSILIHNTHMKMWKTDTAALLRLAQENSPRLFPWECNSMEDVIRELMKEQQERSGGTAAEEEEQRRFLNDMSMQILTSKNHIHGAVCILYPGLLELLSDRAGANLFILPSSIHEVILLADRGHENVNGLKEMIGDVNRTQVEPEEVLSDNLYYYDRVEKTVKII